MLANIGIRSDQGGQMKNFQVDNYGEIKFREPAVPPVLATTHLANII